MASLNRAYGLRGALMALGMAGVAGGVHGVLAHSFDYTGLKVAIGLAGSVVLIMAGAISARHQTLTAIWLGAVMGLLFFATRWSGWSLMEGGAGQMAAFLTTPPWGWPAYLAAFDISTLWLFEAISMTVVALIGCLLGQERPE